jgi:uncharacterized membrane protein
MLEWWTGRARSAARTTTRSIPRPGADPAPPKRARPPRFARLLAATGATLIVGTALAPATLAVQSITLTTPYPAISVAPGTSVSFNITVEVTERGRVDLATGGTPSGWEARLLGGGNVINGVLAEPVSGDEAPVSVRLDVDVPSSAQNGTSTIVVTGTGGGASDRLEIDIRVDAEAAGELTLEADISDQRGTAETTYTFTLTLDNGTAEDLTFATAAVAPAAGWVVNATIAGQAQAASATIDAGSTETISVSVDPPDTASAGVYPFAVTVTAGEQTVQANLSVDITGSVSMTLGTPDDLLSVRGSAGSGIPLTVEVTNTGTDPLDAVSLSGTGPTGWTIDFGEGATVNVAAGQTVQATATITPVGAALSGDYTVTINARAEDLSESLTIRVTVEPSPVGLVIGAAILIAVVAGLWWVFRTYGRR